MRHNHCKPGGHFFDDGGLNRYIFISCRLLCSIHLAFTHPNGTKQSSLPLAFGGLLLHSQKKSFRRIYDLGVSCKADCREILVDYSPAFHVILSLSDAFLSAFLTFVMHCPYVRGRVPSLGACSHCETSLLRALHFFGQLLNTSVFLCVELQPSSQYHLLSLRFTGVSLNPLY